MKKKKIYKDKKGRELSRESYFVYGKMKSRKTYLIDGIPADEFYKRNATDMDFYLNRDYEMMNLEKDHNHQNDKQSDSNTLPF